MTQKHRMLVWIGSCALAIVSCVSCEHEQAPGPPEAQETEASQARREEPTQSRPAEAEPGGHARKNTVEVTIGAVLPLTGNNAECGQSALTALQVAAEEIDQHGCLRIHLVTEDDQAKSSRAVSAMQKLITEAGARFVIGGFTSSCSEAMYPIAERAGVLMFSSSTSTPSLSEDTPLFFRNWPSDRDQARIFAGQTIHRFKKKSVSLLYSNTEYGVDVSAIFQEAYEGLGGKVVIAEAYKPAATDFQTQIKRFLDNPADGIWLFGYYNEMGHFLKQAREGGLRTQFFGQEGIEATELLEIAGEGAEELIYFVPVFDPGDDSREVRRFVRAFKAKLGREPDVVAAHAYDALHILARSIEAVGPDPQKVAKHLSTVKDYPGVSGLTTLDENGDAKKPVMAKTIQNGRFVRWKAPEELAP